MLNIWLNMKNILKPVISRTGMIKGIDKVKESILSPFAISLLPIYLSKIILFISVGEPGLFGGSQSC